jgi:ribonuclease R
MKRRGKPPRDRGTDNRQERRSEKKPEGRRADHRSPSSRSGAAKPEGGAAGLVFTDRSGKTHTIGKRAGPEGFLARSGIGGRREEPAPAPSSREERPRGPRPKGKGARSQEREEPRHRPRDRRFDERAPGKKSKRGGRDRDREEESPRRGRSRGNAERREKRDLTGTTKMKAVIDKNRKGFGFLQFENRQFEDAFLPPHEAERFFHGDRVEASVTEEGEVVDLRVISHRFRELVGRFYPMGRNGVVVYERKKAREEVPVSGSTRGAKSRQWVRAKVLYPDDDERSEVECEILEVYGDDLPATADIQMVAAEYNLVEEHSAEAVKEAEGFQLDLDDPNRVDLRHLPFITIDGETARDFDDAIFVERTHSGGFVLWVAIADVSHYVREDTALNDEAYSRATSVYFPERAFHMLPRALSENLCSLRPNEPRLTMTSKIEYDSKGKKLRVDVMNTLIFSRRRATYNEIQAETEARENDPSWEYKPHLELYRVLRKLRTERGSIDFDLPEAEVRVDSNTGEPISIKNRPRLDAHRLIEEFMIAANESVTEWALDRKLPFLYRTHADPPQQALLRFQELAANYGVNFALPSKHGKAGEKKLADALNSVVRSIEGHPAQTMLNNALLRSMAQAQYSSVYGEHFGLASEAYTHFTSPIRRYPDLVVHRMLKLALENERGKRRMGEEEKERLEVELYDIAEHCSYRERIASEAERESIKLKQVRIMLKEIGNEFEGKVMGMNESGLFVGIPDPFVEGFLAANAMPDDFYQYNEQRQIFHGKRSKKSYKIGDKIQVRVERVDIDLRRIDFAMV